MCARFVGIAEEPYVDEARSLRIVPELLIERSQVDSFVVPPAKILGPSPRNVVREGEHPKELEVFPLTGSKGGFPR